MVDELKWCVHGHFTGLFHRAIIMSGSALSDWAIANHPLQATMQVIQSLNCPLREDNEEMLVCLRKKRYILKRHHIIGNEFIRTLAPPKPTGIRK